VKTSRIISQKNPAATKKYRSTANPILPDGNARQTFVDPFDVELDQLLTSFRLTLANLLVFLAKEILEEAAIEMTTLIQSILYLPGRIENDTGRRRAYIKNNERDPAFMRKLTKGLSKLNALNIRHPGGPVYEFKLE